MSVNIKFNGEYAVVNLSFENGKPVPTLSGLGTIFSSLSLTVPAPNPNCNVVDFELVLNLIN